MRMCDCGQSPCATCTCPSPQTALEARVAACEVRLATWTPPAAPAAPIAPIWPFAGAKYYIVNSYGETSVHWWRSSNVDLGRKARGTLFRTESEARKADRRSVVTEKLRALSDYTEQADRKYRIAHDAAWHIAYINGGFCPGAVYFATANSAGNAIKVLGTELDVLLP